MIILELPKNQGSIEYDGSCNLLRSLEGEKWQDR